MERYDVIVVGLGVMGSAAAWQIARRGLRVLAFDRYTPPHTLGSTHGRTRIIREAYFEHPSYVPFIRRAYELWDETARAANAELFVATRGLMIGRPEGEIVAGALASAREHGVTHELLSATELRRRFPVFTPDEGMVGVLESRAGVLFAERCVDVQLRLAVERGAVVRCGERVAEWRSSAADVEVRTEAGDAHEADRLVLAVGPWAPELLEGYGVPLVCERQLMYWFEPLDHAGFGTGECPIAVWDEGAGAAFATFPDFGDGVKIAIHHGGAATDPDTVDRTPRAEDEAAARDRLRRYVPAANGALRDAAVCLYTNTPDQHFIIDYLDEHRRVVLASPCSGHGFKFASAVGETVAHLVADEPPPVDIALFSLDRLGAPSRRR